VDSCDRLILERAREGDTDAFSRLVEIYWMSLVRFARSIVGDAESEDVVQESFVAAWQKIGSLQNPDSFHPWMLRIVSRRCFRRAGLLARFAPWTEALLRPEPRALPSDTALMEVEEALSALPRQQRAVMHLTVMEEMSDSEIGAVLGIRAASVRSHRRRARQQLMRLVKAEPDGREEMAS